MDEYPDHITISCYTQTHCQVFLCYQAPDLHLLEVFHWLCKKIKSQNSFLNKNKRIYVGMEPSKTSQTR